MAYIRYGVTKNVKYSKTKIQYLVGKKLFSRKSISKVVDYLECVG